MRLIRKASTALIVLLGVGVVSCIADSSDPNAPSTDRAESVATQEQPFNTGPAPAGQIRGHEEITKKAILYLAQRNLLPAPLMTAANQALLIYGDDFADHPWFGRPESPNTAVPNRMTSLHPRRGASTARRTATSSSTSIR